MRIRKLVLIVTLLVLPLLLVSCNSNSGLIQIGILQTAKHEALDDARIGFIEELAINGFIDGDNIKITVIIPGKEQTDMDNAAKQLVRKSDLILAIATPAATAVVTEAKESKKDTPILFTAVTDPVDAKLITSNEKPGGFVTGTNDMNPIAQQIALAKELLPDATTLGILFNGSETNSNLQGEIAKLEAEKLGFTVTIAKVNSINDIKQVGGNLASKVDVIYTPTDNLMAESVLLLNEISNLHKVPFIVGEDALVKHLPGLTIGLNYKRLGKETATMAVMILKDGILPADIPSHGLVDLELVVNKNLLESIGVTVPQAIIDRADSVIK